MLRTPLIALLALLAGVALACSDRVPPQGATLSGVVYHDSNANGVRDDCDDLDLGVLTLELDSTGPEGGKFSASTDSDSVWRIEHIPRGEYSLTLAVLPMLPPGVEAFWLTTQPLPVELSIKGYEVLDDIDIGMGHPSLLTGLANHPWAYSVIFDDEDRDGTSDEGECVIEPIRVHSPGSGAIVHGENGRPNALEVYPHVSNSGSEGGGVNEFWEATSEWARSGCYFAPVHSVLEHPDVYEASLGVTPARGTSRITANIFKDLDADGERDDGEPLIPDGSAILEPHATSCLLGRASKVPSESGSVVFDDLPAAMWRVTASMEQGCYLNTGCSLVSPAATWGQGEQVGVGAGDRAVVNLGYYMQELSELVVKVVEDTNGNGAVDPQEPYVPDVGVCYLPSESTLSHPQSCRPTSSTGIVRFRVSDRNGEVYVAATVKPNGGWTTTDPPYIWTVDPGETVSTTLLIRRE
jgi:hypothetical protein